MQKTHTNPDGSKEYIMSCEDKATCEGLSYGFHSIVGRRDDNDRSRRDLSFHCCEIDRCNFPTEFMTTTTQMPFTTTSPPPTTTLKPLHNCSRDIVFVLDGSSTIGAQNHNYMKIFVERIIGSLRIGLMDSLVAVVEYSDTARVEWYLTDHTSALRLSQAAANIPYVEGSTGTHAALYLVRASVLTSKHGARPNAKDVVIVVTDGGTDAPDLTASEAQKLEADGATVIVVGIGRHANTTDITRYLTEKHSLSVGSFHSLPFITSSVLGLICQ